MKAVCPGCRKEFVPKASAPGGKPPKYCWPGCGLFFPARRRTVYEVVRLDPAPRPAWIGAEDAEREFLR